MPDEVVINKFTQALSALRGSARAAAAQWLVQNGFASADANEWIGTLQVPAAPLPILCRVRLPLEFPDCLPEIFVSPADFTRRIAHIGNDGKICIAPESGTMIDGDRPERVMKDAIARAAFELQRGLSGSSDPDLHTEYLAYWPDAVGPELEALVNATGAARPLVRWHRQRAKRATVLLTESRDLGLEWGRRVGDVLTVRGSSYLIPLASDVPLPPIGTSFSVRDVFALLKTHATESEYTRFRAWCAKMSVPTAFPLTVIVLLPARTALEGRTMIALEIRSPAGDVAKRARAGFRAGHVPATRVFSEMANAYAQRRNVERLDGPFLLTRGGGQTELLNRTVIVAGVGAVGSEVAAGLMGAGVGAVHLVDPDEMNTANVHRHLLGMDDVGSPKAIATAASLTKRFPHLNVTGHSVAFDVFAQANAAVIATADLLILATGEENDELRINSLLRDGPPRLHTWLDPLGVAGHALLGGVKGVKDDVRGCYQCVVVPDPVYGFVNKTSLVAPGQFLQRSFAGCAGTFNSFAASASKRTALEAVDLAVAFLTGAVTSGRVVTWRALTPMAPSTVRLSSRAKVVAPGATTVIDASEFARDSCPVCRLQVGSVKT